MVDKGGKSTGSAGPAGPGGRQGEPRPQRTSSPVRRLRDGSVWVRARVAALVGMVASLCAAVLAIGALLVAFDGNDQNSVYQWFTDSAQTLAGPLDNLFRLDDDAKETLVNWGIAAAAYLVVGRIVQRILKP